MHTPAHQHTPHTHIMTSTLPLTAQAVSTPKDNHMPGTHTSFKQRFCPHQLGNTCHFSPLPSPPLPSTSLTHSKGAWLASQTAPGRGPTQCRYSGGERGAAVDSWGGNPRLGLTSGRAQLLVQTTTRLPIPQQPHPPQTAPPTSTQHNATTQFGHTATPQAVPSAQLGVVPQLALTPHTSFTDRGPPLPLPQPSTTLPGLWPATVVPALRLSLSPGEEPQDSAEECNTVTCQPQPQTC